MRQFRKRLLLALGLALLLALLAGCDGTDKKSLPHEETLYFDDIPYEMDTAPLEEHFPGAGNIEHAYWKSKPYNEDRVPGPVTYRTTGFMIVDELAIPDGEEYTDISYPDFAEGIDPFITGLSVFDWREYPSVTKRILGSRFVGIVYVDVGKNLIFFDVENT